MTMVSAVIAISMMKMRLNHLNNSDIEELIRHSIKSKAVRFTEKGDQTSRLIKRMSIDHPFGTGISFIETLDREDLEKYMDDNFPTRAEEGSKAAAQASKGGAPRTYDWDAFYIEVIRLANTPDGLPQSQAELERIMAEWFIAKGWKEPSHGTLGPKVSRIYKALR